MFVPADKADKGYNVAPGFAEVFYYVRHPDSERVEVIRARLENAARGAAMGTGTEVEWEVIHGNSPPLDSSDRCNEDRHPLNEGWRIRAVAG